MKTNNLMLLAVAFLSTASCFAENASIPNMIEFAKTEYEALNSLNEIFSQKQTIDIDEKDEYGDTALMHAIERNWLGVIELLLLKGANIYEVNKDRETALAYAIRLYSRNISYKSDKDESLKTIKYLIEIGKADINANHHIALYTALNTPIREENKDLINYLISKGATLGAGQKDYAIDYYGETQYVKKGQATYKQDVQNYIPEEQDLVFIDHYSLI